MKSYSIFGTLIEIGVYFKQNLRWQTQKNKDIQPLSSKNLRS